METPEYAGAAAPALPSRGPNALFDESLSFSGSDSHSREPWLHTDGLLFTTPLQPCSGFMPSFSTQCSSDSSNSERFSPSDHLDHDRPRTMQMKDVMLLERRLRVGVAAYMEGSSDPCMHSWFLPEPRQIQAFNQQGNVVAPHIVQAKLGGWLGIQAAASSAVEPNMSIAL